MKVLNNLVLMIAAVFFMALGATTLSAQDSKCGAGKCGSDTKKVEKKAQKCGAGKCGASKKVEKKATPYGEVQSDEKVTPYQNTDERDEKTRKKCGMAKCS